MRRERTLLNVADPLALFYRSFEEHMVKPQLETNARIRQEHEQRDRDAVRAIERERAAELFRQDARDGLLHRL